MTHNVPNYKALSCVTAEVGDIWELWVDLGYPPHILRYLARKLFLEKTALICKIKIIQSAVNHRM
jgi:hypothetical protein